MILNSLPQVSIRAQFTTEKPSFSNMLAGTSQNIKRIHIFRSGSMATQLNCQKKTPLKNNNKISLVQEKTFGLLCVCTCIGFRILRKKKSFFCIDSFGLIPNCYPPKCPATLNLSIFLNKSLCRSRVYQQYCIRNIAQQFFVVFEKHHFDAQFFSYNFCSESE